MIIHKPVLLDETLDLLVTNKSGIYFDGTLGFGGHSTGILKRLNRHGKVVGSDKDKEAFDYCKKQFAGEERFEPFLTSFVNIDKISKILFIDKFDGILADLGVSSYQLDNADKGFTYREDVPLDLRMDRDAQVTAADILNDYDEKEIARILFEFGEEKKSRRIAAEICRRREEKPIKTTGELKEIISSLVPPNFLNKSLSRVFQALRIEVNNELEELKEFLNKSVDLLKIGGRIAIITFHSLEDRIVKEFFKYEALDCICPPEFPVCRCDKEAKLKIITKKPVVAGDLELKDNYRARSAKLRVAERI
ncbi:MAG: 16S rRNA (cytosine(1402)-N(4))-methyltransferase RsmH [Ignavibacteria bacterium]|nr:MAG: 16S rRNA (cytosine(1402)-N(4))-methyltransferase RsmH [Ignavibacteria bacterium]